MSTPLSSHFIYTCMHLPKNFLKIPETRPQVEKGFLPFCLVSLLPVHAVRLVFCMLFMCPLLYAQDADFLRDLYEQGHNQVKQQLPELGILLPEVQEIDWEWISQEIQRTLQSYSWEDVAALLPDAETTLDYLYQVPGGEPYAAWLKPRLDYLEIASRIVKRQPQVQRPAHHPRTRPAPGSRRTVNPPPDRLKSTPVSPRPYTPPDISGWERALKNRDAPKDARRLILQLKKIFADEGIPAEWIWMAEVESSLNPQARSPVGAAGLFQFMPATAKRFGLKLMPRDERLDPDKSARAAAQYLRILYHKFNSWPLALAAYNAGEGRIQRLLNKNQVHSFKAISPHLPVETQMYVPKIMATVALRENIDPESLPPPQG